MSSRNYVGGINKPTKTLNPANSVYQGKSVISAGRGFGPLGKNALQPLGKPAQIVRRMPPPATLPSIKAECGQDNINLAQQGWNKSTIDSANDSKSTDNFSKTTTGGASEHFPKWAKGTTANADAVSTAQSQRKTVAPNNRDFPSLEMSMGTASKESAAATQPNVLESPQKSTTRLESAVNEEEHPIAAAVPPPPLFASNYITASTRTDVNRKLPDRFYGGTQETRTSVQRYDVRQKLAQLSMESKESPPTPTEKSSSQSTTTSSKPVISETTTTVNSESESPASFTTQQQQNMAPQPLMQKDLKSQDARQYYAPPPTHHMPPMAQPLNELPQTAAWNREAANDAGFENDYQVYRNDNQSPNVPIQPSSGPGNAEMYSRNAPAAQHVRGAPRFGNPGQHVPQRFGSNANWEDYPNAAPNWNMPMPDERHPTSRPAYRNESEAGWYASQQQQQQQPAHRQRRNDSNPNGWNYSMNEYDNYHPSQRSRTTSNEYEQGMYPAQYPNDRRYKGHPKNVEEQPPYEYGYAEDYDRRQYRDYKQQDQPAYQILKRNDEKSAEYFSNAGESELIDEDSLALSQLTRLGRSSKPINFGSMNSESPEIASDTFDSSIEQRKTPQQVPAQQKFNRAPSKTQSSVDSNPLTQQPQHSAPKPIISPAENVWQKRMEDLKIKQQEEKANWQNSKQQHRKFDYHFPAISDKKSDSLPATEPEPLVQQPVRSSSKQSLQRNSSVNQRAPSKWDEPPSWNEEFPPEQPAKEDSYEGREFYNRQLSQGNRTAGSQKSNSSYRTGGGSQKSSVPEAERRPLPQRRKRNEPEDNFSDMGVFNAEDYKVEDPRHSSHQSSARYDKDENKSNGGSRQNGSRKMLNSDERNRQLKPQRASGTRTWQRQQQSKSIVEEAVEETEQPAESESQKSSTQQRPANPRNQRSNQGSSQPRPQQQQSNRRNTRTPKGLTPQSADQQPTGGKPVIKSPARSENGLEEWETASESSDLHGRKTDAGKKPPQNRPKTREKTPRESNGNSKTATNDGQQPTQRSNAGQKNVKPANHTFHQNNEEFVKSKNEPINQLHKNAKNTNDSRKNARESRPINKNQTQQPTKTTKNALAGYDINDASVVIIDQTPSNGTDTISDNGDFEEVVSRKVKRQRQLQKEQEERKSELRQKLREEKQRKPVKKISTPTPAIDNQQNDIVKTSDEKVNEPQQTFEPKPLSSISPISAADSGVAAISSTSPPQLAVDGDQSGLQTHVSVSIPAQHPVWNSPSPQIVNSVTTLSDEIEPPPLTASTIKPIARPKQRIDSDAKNKIASQQDLHTEISTFGSKGLDNANYAFGYEHSITSSDDPLALNMAKIKDFWPGETDTYISGSLFKQPIGVKNNTASESDTKAGSDVNQKMTEKDENNVTKSRSSVNRQFSNNSSQSPLNSTPMTGPLFGNPVNLIYSNGYNPVTSYSTLLDNNVRDFMSNPPFAQTNSPPVQLSQTQAFVGTRSMNAFANPAAIYVSNNGQTTASNDWPTNNTDLLNTINSTSPLHMPNAFNNTVPTNVQPMPLNYNVPPPPIGKFAPNFPPPTVDYRFPPPSARSNFPNARNAPPPFNNPANNGNRSNQQQRRPSNTGRQNSSPIIAAPSPFFAWNAKSSNQQQHLGLF